MLKHPLRAATDLCVFGANGSGKRAKQSFSNTLAHESTEEKRE